VNFYREFVMDMPVYWLRSANKAAPWALSDFITIGFYT